MAQVNDEVKKILDRQLHGLPTSGNKRSSIFSFASRTEIAILVLSSLCAIAAGVLFPIMTVIYGQLVHGFNGFSAGTTTESKLRSTISQFSLFYVYLAVAVFVLIYVSTVGFYYTGEKMARSLRHEYLKSVLRQNIAYFDVLSTGEVSSRIMSDMGVIQEGVSHKLSLAITAIATFGSALVISFVMYWKTALIMSPTYIVMLIIGTIAGRQAISFMKVSREYKASGANIAEETIASVRQVAAYGMANFLSDKYDHYLKDGEASGIKSRNSFAAYGAWCNAMPSLVYGLSFWAGSIYLVKGEISVAGVTTTALTISVGAFAIVRVAPCFEALFASTTSAEAVLKTIAIESPQDPFASGGTKLPELKGDICFRDVSLIYPSRDDVLVLDKVNFNVPAARTTAIVGSSGCGKSSIVALLERFYEPVSGQVMIDGHDIQAFNLAWLRSQISLVGQEPVLFSTTIFENIRNGLVNCDGELSPAYVKERVISAAKKANAHDFIQGLPLAYETQVGQKGLQLSGGQRQRISIARALIKDPKLLLLDEATSALDTRSEAAVQRALESAAVGRTTIVVAHRLSTIQKADNIIVMSEGRIVEQGKHEALMSLEGVYAGFVQKQQLNARNHDDDAEFEEDPVHQILPSKGESQRITSEKLTVSEKQNTDNFDANSHFHVAASSKVSLWDTLGFITSLNKPEWKYLLFGLITAILAGAVVPVQSLFFAKLLAAFAYPKSEYGMLRSTVNAWAGYYVALAAIAFITYGCQGLCFAYSTERLLHRAKDRCLRSILRQDISFFDEEEHSSGKLTSLLNSSTEDLTALSGVLIGSILTFISTIVTGLVVSIAIGWKLALVCTATIPLVVACGWVRLQVLVVFDEQIRQSGKDSAAYASEAVSAMKTVASLGLENHVLVAYDKILDKQAGNFMRSILSASALYAASQSAALLASALAFWYGGGLIANREYTVFQFYICFVTLVIGSQIAGAVFSYAPDASKAMYATQELKKIFNRVPRIKNNSSDGLRVGKAASGGKIEIHHVNFTYPSRLDRPILHDFNLTVEPGQYIAFVGPSGSGKSTILSLLERFYDPSSGKIKIDGQDISHLNIDDFRNLVSLVSQETTLYSGTIRENIVMGLGDNISDEDIVRVCKLANIHSFIESLSEGFTTFVGARGSMLSGGQRQRIAIARALLRDPVILLLDEATSALDTESEKIVQDALDVAAKDRTTIAIAHRLSTIKKADKIFVLDQGHIVQVGTHSELIAVEGIYLDLVNMQSFQ